MTLFIKIPVERKSTKSNIPTLIGQQG